MKLLEKAKYILIGALIMAFFTMTIPSYAATTAKQITAYFNNIKIYRNDSLIQPKDSTGKVIEPFVYNGSVYLPVRAVADALGQSVVWESKTSGVYFGTHDSTTPAANLQDLTLLLEETIDGHSRTGWHWIPAAGVEDNLENLYYSGVYFHDEYSNYAWGGDHVFLTNGKYKSFKGTIALTADDKNTTGSSTVKIYGDDKLLYTSPKITKGVKPQKFNIDITGVNQLKIQHLLRMGNVADIILADLNLYN